jgi:hypothetical protein
LDSGGDAVAGLRLDDADGEAAQRGDVGGAVLRTDGAAILVPVPVQNVVTAVFDRPVAAIEAQYAGGVGAVAGMTGQPVDGLGGGLAGFLVHVVALDGEGLADTGKIQIVLDRESALSLRYKGLESGPMVEAPGLPGAVTVSGAARRLATCSF